MDEVTCQDNSRKKRDPIKPVRERRGSFCCCKCRLSVSSSSSSESERVENCPMSSLAAHAMVQRRLDQIAAQGRRRRKKQMAMPCKCIVMLAMDKESYDPKADFRRSMVEVIASNKIEEPRELRCLLNCYMSINSEECRPIILEAFHEACTGIFM